MRFLLGEVVDPRRQDTADIHVGVAAGKNSELFNRAAVLLVPQDRKNRRSEAMGTRPFLYAGVRSTS
jgi:hypothetical protein